MYFSRLKMSKLRSGSRPVSTVFLLRKKVARSPHIARYGAVSSETVTAPGFVCLEREEKMNKILLTVALVLSTTTAPYADFTAPKADVWNPGKTLPSYRVKQQSNGDIRIHAYGNPF